MDRIRQLLENLQNLTPEELTELQGLIDTTFDDMAKVPDAEATADSVSDMEYLINGMESVRGEVTRREAEAAETAQKRADMRERADALRNPPKDEAPETAPEEVAPEGAPAPVEGEAPAEGEEETDEEKRAKAAKAKEQAPEGEGQPATDDAGNPLVPVAASAQPARGSIGSSGMIPAMAAATGPAQASPDQPTPAPYGASIVATAGNHHIPPGTPLEDPTALAEAMAERLRTLQSAHDFSQQLVASAHWEYPKERQLGGDADVNTERINAVCDFGAPRADRQTGALVATGGICLPVNVDYAVPTWSTADRPLRDGLPAFQATRGGIRFVSPPDIGVPSLQGTASGAGLSTGIWTEATDASPGGATKPVWTVACGAEQLVYVNAVTTRVQFGNMQSRFAPEQVAANTQQAVAVTAREAELELLTLLAANTKQVVPQHYLGAVRDLLPTVDLTVEQYRYSHRFPDNIGLTAIFPAWAKGLFRSDMAREAAHDNAGSINVLAISDAEIEDWFSARGISNIIWTLDGLKAGTYGTGGGAITAQFFPVMTAGAQPQWPGQTSDGAFQLVWFLYVEGTFQFLDGGRLDLGVVRDSLLDATNDYETFTETFEGLAFRGIEAYQVQQTVLPTGISSAAGSPTYHE
jgi:hypothetical protein